MIFGWSGNPSVPVFLSPAVTPWTSKLERGANNPSIRLYKYSKKTGKVIEILQYFLNLTAANINNQADWLMEYEFTKTYGTRDMSAWSLRHLAEKFKPHESELFLKYYVHYQVSNKPVPCDSKCKQQLLCSITQVDYKQNAKCQNGVKIQPMVYTTTQTLTDVKPTRHFQLPPPPQLSKRPHHHHHPVPRYMYIVIYSLVILVVILFVGITVYCCCREPRRVTYLSQPRYVLIS